MSEQNENESMGEACDPPASEHAVNRICALARQLMAGTAKMPKSIDVNDADRYIKCLEIARDVWLATDGPEAQRAAARRRQMELVQREYSRHARATRPEGFAGDERAATHTATTKVCATIRPRPAHVTGRFAKEAYTVWVGEQAFDTDYDMDRIVAAVKALDPPLTVEEIKAFSPDESALLHRLTDVEVRRRAADEPQVSYGIVLTRDTLMEMRQVAEGDSLQRVELRTIRLHPKAVAEIETWVRNEDGPCKLKTGNKFFGCTVAIDGSIPETPGVVFE